MAWGSDTAATQLTGITTEQFFDQVPTLNPRETAHLQVAVDFPASPTDHAIVAVYTTYCTPSLIVLCVITCSGHRDLRTTTLRTV
jgi:hypothetical protein